MAATLSFFKAHKLPVFDFLSHRSVDALEQYLITGNREYRERLLLEFFRCLEWLTLAETRELKNNPIKKLDVSAQIVVYRDLKNYFEHKARQRQAASAKRQDHKLRVYEYFRNTVPRSDKQLLEQLRDYELNETGRDTNWQHYFAMRSFKQIDQFLALGAYDRLQLITRFKQDVLTYKKNLEKLNRQQRNPGAEWDFNVDHLSFEDLFGKRQQQRYTQQNRSQQDVHQPVRGVTQFEKDCHLLGVRIGAPFDLVKKRFRQLVRVHHPDVVGGSETMMKELVAAYDRLKRQWINL